MKIKKILVPLSFGLGLTLAIMWLLSGGQMPRPKIARAAGSHHVAPGGNCGTASPCYATIQAAVDAVVDPGDVIKVAAGVYTDIHARAGITQVVYISKTVIVRGGYTTIDWDTPDPAAHPTTLDAQGLGRVLVINGTITPPTIEGLRITSGDATGLGGDPWGNDSGGGVYLRQAAGIISNCTIYSNTASATGQGYGGGLYILESDAVLTDNTVLNNTASSANNGDGGGLYLYDSNATLNGNSVLTNIASTANRGSGGGLSIYDSIATLNSNTVQGNTATTGISRDGSGGGLYLRRSDITLIGNTVMSNTASTSRYGYGGGLYLYESGATLSDNTIVSNTATLNPSYTGRGGGLWVQHSSPLTLTNNLVADNHANTEGSGLWLDGESGNATAGSLLHTTIADNHGSGQGVYVGDYTMLAFTNTIVSGHGSVGITVKTGSTVTLAATLWHGNGTETGGGGTIISSANVYGDPAFADPAAGDYHLTTGSAAIDAGVNAGVVTDIDGDPRPLDTGYDIGADEYHSCGVLLAPNHNGSALPGTVITYTHTLTNSGNYTDTFTLGYSSSQGWASVTPSPVTLAAGGTQQVVVTVSVPAGAAVGMVESTIITATSQAAPTIFDTVTDTTSVEEHRIYLPLILH